MKKIFVFLILFVTLFLVVKSSYAYVRVRGYFRRSTRSYVIPHFRTNPDGFKFNNWSFKGNINPFTFKKGWKW